MASLLPQSSETPPVDPNAPPVEGQPPVETPPVEGQPPIEGAVERPEWFPEAAWKEGGVDFDGLKAHIDTLGPKQTDVPADPVYALPEIDGFDKDKAAASPLFKALMAGAHANGIGQAAFEGIVTSYAKEMVESETLLHQAEVAKLGSNVETRLQSLSNWLGASLGSEQAEAIRAMTTSADAVLALEALMNRNAPSRPRIAPPPPVQAKTRADIEQLMKSPAYIGKQSERDPKVIAEVEAWFEAEAKREGKA